MNNRRLLDEYLSNETVSKDNCRWMLTFADLLSLILTFFVLLFSMSEIDLEQWTKITKSLSQSLNPNSITFNTLPSQNLDITKIQRTKSTNLDYLTPIIKRSLSDTDGIKDIAIINHLDERIIISLPYNLMFIEDKNELTPLAHNILDTISSTLLALNNHIDIYGNSPTSYAKHDKYNNSWELSLARAIAMSQYLREKGYQYKITPYGRDNQGFEALSGITESHKEKLLHTVDIVIRSHEAKQ